MTWREIGAGVVVVLVIGLVSILVVVLILIIIIFPSKILTVYIVSLSLGLL